MHLTGFVRTLSKKTGSDIYIACTPRWVADSQCLTRSLSFHKDIILDYIKGMRHLVNTSREFAPPCPAIVGTILIYRNQRSQPPESPTTWMPPQDRIRSDLSDLPTIHQMMVRRPWGLLRIDSASKRWWRVTPGTDWNRLPVKMCPDRAPTPPSQVIIYGPCLDHQLHVHPDFPRFREQWERARKLDLTCCRRPV